MQTTKIYRLGYLNPSLFERLRNAQMEAAKIWNLCKDVHLDARKTRTQWPNQTLLQKATKSNFSLHSQSIQMVAQAFAANIESTRENRKKGRRMRYPWRTKKFYPVSWPAQAVKVKQGKISLPMGRGRKPLGFDINDLPENIGACRLVWNRGFELHVSLPLPESDYVPGGVKATIDLGEIHLAAVTTDSGKGFVVSGRGIRSLKRQRSKALSKIARKQSRCKKYSKRWKKLQRAKNKIILRYQTRIRDLRHKATHQVVEFCKTHGVGEVYIGNPHGVRNRNCGRHHNSRMALWEYGKDIDYLTYKLKACGIKVIIGTERGTSSQCPRANAS